VKCRVNDTLGPIGNGLRAIVGAYSEPQVRLIIGTVWIINGTSRSEIIYIPSLFVTKFL